MARSTYARPISTAMAEPSWPAALGSLYMWGCAALVTLVFPFAMFLVFLVSLPFDRTGAWAHRVGAEWGRTILRLAPGWRVRVEGAAHLRDGPFVIVANHQSHVDVLVSFFLPHHFKWLSKHSVFSVPFLGWMMRMCRYISVRRGDRGSAAECLKTSADWIRRGVSVLFFPEGTRSPDGRLGSFKSGAFQVAAATGAPILPVAILGTEACLPKKAWRIGRRGVVRVVVGRPIPSEGVTAEQVPAFAAQVRQQFMEFKATLSESRQSWRRRQDGERTVASSSF